MNRRNLALSLVALIVAGTIAGIWWHRDYTKKAVTGSPGQQETFWKERIEDVGGKKAYAQFAQAVEDLSPARQHESAHAFGAALFAIEDTEGLAVCDARFSYGCFHEFLGRAIAAHGLAIVTQLNQGCVDSLVESPLSCQHGIGHGILAHMGYGVDAVLKALDECRRLPYNDPIGGCYGGVFMEYNVQTMLGTEARLRSPDDVNAPYEPCDALPSEYKVSCVFWQPQWWNVAILQGGSDEASFKRLGEYCASMTTHTELRRTCFEGIGNITAPSANFDPVRIRELCDATSADPKDRLYCRSLAANSLSNGGAGQKGKGEDVCADLPQAHRAYCESYATNRANILDALESPL